MESSHPCIKRISFLKVPIDILAIKDIDRVIKELSEDKGRHQIVLINFFDFMKARRNKHFLKTLNEASLVLPTAKSIVSGIKFLKKETAFRYRPFDFVIRLLGIMEKYKKSLYLIGGKKQSLQTVFNNMRISFPEINIVGRYTGYYSKQIEENILIAMKKASPSLILTGDGLKGADKWINSKKESFNPGVYISCRECFAIFSGKKKKGSRKSWENGTEVVGEVLKNPLKVFRIIPRLYYLLVLLIYKIFKIKD